MTLDLNRNRSRWGRLG